MRISDMPAPRNHDGSEDRIGNMADMEKEHMIKALGACQWQIEGKNGAAELLGLNPGTLRGRMRKYDIKRP